MNNLEPLKYDIPPKPNAPQDPPATSVGVAPINPGKKPSRVGFWILGGFLVIGLFFVMSIGSFLRGFSSPASPVDPAIQAQLQLSNDYFTELDGQKPNLSSFENWQGAVFNSGLPCPDGTDSADVCQMATTSPMDKTDNAKICAEVIGVAKNMGAFADVIQGETVSESLGDKSVDRCVAMMKSPQRSVGFAWWSPSYFLVGQTSAGTPFGFQLSLSREGQMSDEPKTLGTEHYLYTIFTSTTFDTAVPSDPQEFRFDYNKPEVQSQALLDSLAYERWMNQKRSPFDPEVAAAAVESFKNNFTFEGKFEAFKSADGKVYWLQVKTKTFEACITTGSEAELNAANSENLDLTPLQTGQTGLTQLGRKVASRADAKLLGDYYLGSCSK